jgi:hypothetical protein
MRLLISISAWMSVVAVDASARAEDVPLTATVQCDRASEPGRVRCTVEARTSKSLQWADVVLMEVPELAQALKGRLGPADSVSRDNTTERWAFGLVAKKTGEGEAKVRVRAIVCEGTRCTPVTALASTIVRVG